MPELGSKSANRRRLRGVVRGFDGGGSIRDSENVAGRVGPVWAEVGEDVLRGYLQRGNSMGSSTAAAVFGDKSGSFGLPKKAMKGGGR